MAPLTITLTEQEQRALEQVAAVEGASVLDVVRRALQNYLVRHTEPNPAWQTRMAEVVARIRDALPAGLDPAEIEADVTAARAEVRRELYARRD